MPPTDKVFSISISISTLRIVSAGYNRAIPNTLIKRLPVSFSMSQVVIRFSDFSNRASMMSKSSYNSLNNRR